MGGCRPWRYRVVLCLLWVSLSEEFFIAINWMMLTLRRNLLCLRTQLWLQPLDLLSLDLVIINNCNHNCNNVESSFKLSSRSVAEPFWLPTLISRMHIIHWLIPAPTDTFLFQRFSVINSSLDLVAKVKHVKAQHLYGTTSHALQLQQRFASQTKRAYSHSCSMSWLFRPL